MSYLSSEYASSSRPILCFDPISWQVLRMTGATIWRGHQGAAGAHAPCGYSDDNEPLDASDLGAKTSGSRTYRGDGFAGRGERDP